MDAINKVIIKFALTNVIIALETLPHNGKADF